MRHTSCSSFSFVRLRALLSTIFLAVGCGSFSEPIEDGEPAPAPAPTPTTAPAPSEQPSQSGDPAASGQAASNPPSPGTSPTTGCKVGFQKDVLPKLADTCGQAACHGAQVSRPFIEADAPNLTHQELMEFEFGSIEWSDPHSEYSGAGIPEVKKVIDAWRLCGAKLD